MPFQSGLHACRELDGTLLTNGEIETMNRALAIPVMFILLTACTSAPTPTPAPIATSSPIATQLPTLSALPSNTPTLAVTPTATATATITQKPTIEGAKGVPFPDEQLLANAVQLYAKTMDLDAKKVATEISYRQYSDKSGNPFTVAITKDNTPLIIYDAEKGWRDITRAELGNKKGMGIGVDAIGWKALQDSKFEQTILKDANHFQIDEMSSWEVLEPKQGNLNTVELKKMEYSIALAKRNGRTLSAGSGIIWGHPSHIPEWLKGRKYSQEELLSIAENHIETFLTPYKSDFQRVAVVNEALTHLLSIPNFWIDTNGIDRKVLMQRAFRKTRAVMPNAELTLREYSIEFAGYPRSDEFFNLVKRLNDEETRVNGRKLIDGVEFQLPLLLPPLIGKDPAMNPSNFADTEKRKQMIEKLRDNIRRFRAIGVSVNITEMFLPIDNLPETMKEKLAMQAEIYSAIYKVCAEESIGVSLFRPNSSNGIDAYPPPKENTLPYPRDGNYNPLPSYYAINAAILSTMK
jgi:GH35 family endo-1,4-beta-xylanase